MEVSGVVVDDGDGAAGQSLKEEVGGGIWPFQNFFDLQLCCILPSNIVKNVVSAVILI